jgi:hypothetical protein
MPDNGNGNGGFALVNVPGSERVSPAFKEKVVQIASDLGTNPNFLMAVMSFETGEVTFKREPGGRDQFGRAATVRAIQQLGELWHDRHPTVPFAVGAANYSHALMRELNPGVIFFNDPLTISEGLTKRAAGHGNHLHVRFR